MVIYGLYDVLDYDLPVIVSERLTDISKYLNCDVNSVYAHITRNKENKIKRSRKERELLNHRFYVTATKVVSGLNSVLKNNVTIEGLDGSWRVIGKDKIKNISFFICENEDDIVPWVPVIKRQRKTFYTQLLDSDVIEYVRKLEIS